MKTLRPKSMTVFAILNFVFGGFGLIFILYAIVAALAGWGLDRLTDLNEYLLFFNIAILKIVVGLLAVGSGIGLIRCATWSHRCTLIYVIAAILGAFLGAPLRSALIHAMSGTAQPFVLTLMDGLWSCIYPIVLLFFLKSSKWKEVFAAHGNDVA